MPPDNFPRFIAIAQSSLARMQLDVAARSPEEACGLLAGLCEADVCKAVTIIPAANALHSPVRYRMDPLEQIAAFNQIEAQGLELVGIYHSHPQGPPDPSPTDIAEAYYPNTVYLIWSPQAEDWQCKGFLIQDQAAIPVEILIDDLE